MPDKLAMVTGAAGGIGLELARRLQGRGFTVLAVERTVELSDTAVAALRTSAPRGLGHAAPALAITCDLSDRASVAELTQRIEAEWARGLDVVICNAGVIVPGDAANASPQALYLQVDVMLASVMQVIAAAARAMRANGRGHILATVSTGGILALPGSAAYSAAKAGLRAYLASVAAELRGTGVAVSGVYPSAVDTPMLLHEATHGGSLLNFVGTVSSVDDVADLFDRALRTRRLELYTPYSDSVLCRFIEAFPWLLPRLLPVLNHLGRRGQRRYLAGKALPSSSASAAG